MEISCATKPYTWPTTLIASGIKQLYEGDIVSWIRSQVTTHHIVEGRNLESIKPVTDTGCVKPDPSDSVTAAVLTYEYDYSCLYTGCN